MTENLLRMWKKHPYKMTLSDYYKQLEEMRLHLADSAPEHGLEEYSINCQCDFCREFRSGKDTRVS